MTAQQPSVRLRGRTRLRLTVVFLGAAIVAFVVGVLVAQHADRKVPGFSRVAVSAGAGQVHLANGKYLAYFESGKVTRGVDRVPLVPVQITGPSGTTTVLDTLYGGKKLSDANGTSDIRSLDYHYHGYNGVALYQFAISRSGSYRVQLTRLPNVPADAKIAFGSSIATGKTVGSVFVDLGFVFLIVAAILLSTGLVARRRHRRKLADLALYDTPPDPTR